MADLDDEDAELYGASAASEVKIAESSMTNNESSLELGIGDKDEDDEANDNAEDDDGVDVIIDQEELHTSPQSQWSKMPNFINKKYRKVEVKVGEQAPSSKEAEDGSAPKGAATAAINPYEYDIASMEDKPWRKPGADISDWFNYGFNEETWQAYSEKQNELRKQNQNRGSIQVVETDRASSNAGGENHNASHPVNSNAQSSFPSPVPPFGMNNMNIGMPGPQWMMGMNPGMGNNPGMGPMGGMGMMKGLNVPGGLMTPESVSSQGDGGNEKDRIQGDNARDMPGPHTAPSLQNWNPEMGPMDLANRGGGVPHQEMYRMMGGAGPYNPDSMVQMQMYGRGLPPGMRPPFHVFPGPPPAGAGRGQGGAWGQADARNQAGGQGGPERMDRERERERANERDRERDRERERDRDRKRGRDEESGRPREDEKRRKDDDRPRDDRPRDRERERDRDRRDDRRDRSRERDRGRDRGRERERERDRAGGGNSKDIREPDAGGREREGGKDRRADSGAPGSKEDGKGGRFDDEDERRGGGDSMGRGTSRAGGMRGGEAADRDLDSAERNKDRDAAAARDRAPPWPDSGRPAKRDTRSRERSGEARRGSRASPSSGDGGGDDRRGRRDGGGSGEEARRRGADGGGNERDRGRRGGDNERDGGERRGSDGRDRAEKSESRRQAPKASGTPPPAADGNDELRTRSDPEPEPEERPRRLRRRHDDDDDADDDAGA